MWIYRIATGEMVKEDGTILAVGWSGQGAHKNNPDSTGVKNFGPLPCGKYSISAPVNTSTHGPYVLRLSPDPSNAMQGRDGFLIHGAAKADPERSSQGCVILQRASREAVWTSGDHTLAVVP
jgi:hypothetical protein